MTVHQLSVYIENKSGALVSVLRLLKQEKIQLIASTIADTVDYGIFRIICSQPEKAYKVLKDAGVAVSLCEVFAVELDDRPGMAADAIELFASEGISLAYLYSFLSEMADEVYVCDAGYAVDQLHSYMFYTYDPTVSYLSRVYNDMYAIVYRCNLVIDHFSDGTSAIMKNAVAEAKVIRSWIYIYLVSMFNTPPIVDHVLKTNDEFRQPNSEPAKAWAWIIETLDEAIASGALDSKSGVDDKSKVRATKEFALSLKGKAQVYSGDYAGAKATLEQVIGSGKYALIPGDQLADLFFTSKGNHNCESIFETNSVMTNDNYKTVAASDNWGAYTPVRVDKFRIADGSYLKEYSAGWNHYTPTDKFLRAIIANEGMYSNRFKAWIYDYEILQEMGLGLA